MRIGIISCSGGSTFIASRAELAEHVENPPQFVVVTDRVCALEDKCDALGIERRRIEDADNDAFSDRAGRVLVDEWGVDAVVLFFHRIVGPGVCARVPTLNIHPSLLPAYRGFSPLKRALADGVDEFGATLHLATADVDAGPILANVRQPMPEDATLERLNSMSYVQKSCLFLLACEAIQADRLRVDVAKQKAAIQHAGATGPCLSVPFATEGYRAAFRSLQAKQDIEGPAIEV